MLNELDELEVMYKMGEITQAEYDNAKAKYLSFDDVGLSETMNYD